LTRSTLAIRFKDVQTLPGTRSFHNFRPLESQGTLEARRISGDEQPTLTYNLRNKCTTLVTEDELCPGCYIACKYDNLWYFGIVREVNEQEEDVTVKFLHLKGPSPSFYWPEREDSCPVPIPHILAVVDPPQTSTGRTYQFSTNCMRLIQKKMVEIEERVKK
jgi:hypothetical protein